jgi:hypothetical protein
MVLVDGNRKSPKLVFNIVIAERYPSELAPMLLPNPTDVDNLVRKLLIWRSNLPYWKQQFEPLGAQLRRYTWADMASRIVSIAASNSVALGKTASERFDHNAACTENPTSFTKSKSSA